MSDDPDGLYQPLAGPEGWKDTPDALDATRWRGGVEQMAGLAEEAPAWADMVRRGMVLMAAYRSGAMAGLYDGDDTVALLLLAGMATPPTCGPAAEAHVVANHAAIVLAAEAGAGPGIVSEGWARRLHAVACGPQQTHPVATDRGVHDHVLGHGDYKHHPNHVRTSAGRWHAFVPVAGVGGEMASLVGVLGGASYAALHPAARAAYVLHGFRHVSPFAAGNGRVARAIATAPLLAAGSVPLVVPGGEVAGYHDALVEADAGDAGSLVRFVGQRCAALVDLTVALRRRPASPDEAAALDRWRARVLAAHRLHAMLPAAVDATLAHHRRRTDLGWLADLGGAAVECTGSSDDAPRFNSPPLSIRVPLDTGAAAEELLVVDPHPLDGEGDAVVLRAQEAEIEIRVRPDEMSAPAPAALARRVDVLLGRAVTALAVRAAAQEGSTRD